MKQNCTSLKTIKSTLIVVLVISACNSLQMPVSTLSVTDTPLPVPPTAALDPAENYEIGVSQVPTGMYLFVEAYTIDECSQGKCGCPAVEPPRAVYTWNLVGDLIVNKYYYQKYFSDSTSTVSSTSLSGLFGYGEWRENLSAINTLPHNEYGTTIYSVDSDGGIVIDIQGKAYLLKPGQSWLKSGRYPSYIQEGCSVHYETRLTNYGLLKRQQILPEE